MKKIIILSLVTFMTVVFLVGFIDVVNQDAPKNKDVFTYSVLEVPTNLIEVGSLNERIQDIVCATSRGLVQLESDGKINTSLSDSLEINDAGLEYIFKIRDDIYWSDGNKITPEDIVAFFREIITEDNEISALLNVFGVKEYINSNKTFSETVAITNTDNSIKIRLNSRDDNFIEELTKPQYKLRKDVLFWENIAYNYKDIPYSGDYCIDNINENEIILKRNNKASVDLAQTIHLVKDDTEDLALAAFEIGNRDIVMNPPKSQLERLKNDGKLVESPSNEAMYLAFNINNENFSNDVKNEIYRLVNKAIEEYQNKNSILVELAECSYFREDKEDLNKLQSRNVMVNMKKDITIPSKVVLVAKESLENKDVTSYLVNWFKNNTDITLVTNLLSEEDMNLISEKNYYDIALINVYAKLDNDEELLNTISSFVPKSIREMIANSNSKAEKEELFAEIEEDIFNNYRILPLLFYNNTIAINNKIESNILDGNGNIDFKSIKK